ncbi:hypothetical protein C0992_001125 [Termitomyces sp. T32_za158]|nr:hypothetical protein C0992_001125 [Termitomyces sp. T32_za158]
MRLPDMCSTSSMVDEIGKSTIYGRLIVTFMETFNLHSLLEVEDVSDLKAWNSEMVQALANAYGKALKKRDHTLSKHLLNWGGPNLFKSDIESSQHLIKCAQFGNAEDLHDLVNHRIDLNCHDSDGWTFLHYAVFYDNMDMVIALIEQKPDQVFAQAKWKSIPECTVLEIAILCRNSDMVTYLLDHDAKSSSHNSLYQLLYPKYHLQVSRIKFLLDRGWDRTVKDAEGKALLDIAENKNDKVLADHLKYYQTVRLPPYGTILHVADEEVKSHQSLPGSWVY